MIWKFLIALSTSIALAACAANGTNDSGKVPAPDPATPEGIAVQAVAKATGAAPGDVSIQSAAAVDFRDASLDCPQPGMAYAQMITPGHKIMVVSKGELYDVRVARGQAMICENGIGAVPPK